MKAARQKQSRNARLWRRGLMGAVGLLLFVQVESSEATVVAYVFSGVLTSVVDTIGLVPPDVNVGDAFAGAFAYDLNAPPFPVDGQYRGIVFGALLESGDTFFRASPLVVISNDVGGRDEFRVFGDALSPPGFRFSSIPILVEGFFGIGLSDDTGTAFSSTNLPVNLNLADFDTANFTIDYGNANVPPVPPNYRIEGEITSLIRILPVPEPTTLLLLGLSLAGLGFARRKLH